MINIIKILNILKGDTELSNILKPAPTDSKIYMYDSNNLKSNSIGYNIQQLTNDGVVGQYRLEINCISADYLLAMSMLNRVQQLLITVGDNNVEDILEVRLNGGGTLFDKDSNLHIIKGIFTIKHNERMM